jgi:hypothetical protein
MLSDSWATFGMEGSDTFDKALQGLERVSQAITSKVQRAIVSGLDEFSAAARERLMEEPVHGAKQTGLRDRIIAGMYMQAFDDDTGSGSKVEVFPPQDNMGRVPWGFDVESEGWRHPVFGNRRKWVSQKGSLSWWQEPVQQSESNIKDSVSDAMSEAVDETFG